MHNRYITDISTILHNFQTEFPLKSAIVSSTMLSSPTSDRSARAWDTKEWRLDILRIVFVGIISTPSLQPTMNDRPATHEWHLAFSLD